MKVHIRLFAVARELAGTDLVSLDVPEGCTIGQLRAALADQVPALAGTLPLVLFALGSDYVRDDAAIPPGSEVACIPPVSGG